MTDQKRPDRRSFLTRILGGAAAVGGALGAVTGNAFAQSRTGRTDSDSRDAINYGRGTTGLNDGDSGAGGDPVGNGRGRRSGVTDSDTTDTSGNGRGTRSGITDSDTTDTSGNGRGTRSGITDSDTTDTSGNGRGTRSGVTDSDTTDASGNGRGTRSGVTDSDKTDANGNGRGGKRPK